MSMKKFAVGDHVRFTDTVVKERHGKRTTYMHAGLPGFLSWSGDRSASLFNTGFIVRIRPLCDYITYRDVEYGEYGVVLSDAPVVEAVPGTCRIAYEVAWHINRKPALVLNEHITLIGGSE